MTRVWAAAALALTVFAPASSTSQATTPATPLPCLTPVPGVTWMRWTESGQETLDQWCGSVGQPVLVTSPATPAEVTRLLIVTWNVHVGEGRVEDFVQDIWKDVPDREHTGLVLLLEETFRAGQDVPDSYPAGLRVPSAIRPRRPTLDVTGLAQQLEMSAAYVPSMRNGRATSVAEREDRGNAVLSTEPLTDIRAIELPFGKQRRVAVAATVTPRGGSIGPLRVIVTHFDTNDQRIPQAEALGMRIAGLGGLPMVVGADLNARRGFDDESVEVLVHRVPLEPCGTGHTNRWPLRLDVLAFFIGRTDFMFSTLASSGLVRECRTIGDAYGSDHLPVLLTVHR